MGHERNTTARRSRLLRAVAVTGVLAVWAAATYAALPLFSTLSDPARTRAIIAEAGSWGPLLFVAIQAVQVLIAPVPGQVTAIVGGYLFGPLLGLAYTLAGSTLGTWVVILLSRKLGRPFVSYFVTEERLKRFDDLATSKGPLAFFLIFLLPAFPDDVVALVAGLTAIPVGTLVLISVAGRLPGYAVLTVTGSGLTQENLNPVAVTAAAIALIFAAAMWKRHWLRDLVASDDSIAFVKERWAGHWGAVALWVLGILAVLAILYALATLVPSAR